MPSSNDDHLNRQLLDYIHAQEDYQTMSFKLKFAQIVQISKQDVMFRRHGDFTQMMLSMLEDMKRNAVREIERIQDDIQRNFPRTGSKSANALLGGGMTFIDPAMMAPPLSTLDLIKAVQMIPPKKKSKPKNVKSLYDKFK